MALQRLVVPVVLDSAAFKRGLKESEAAATRFEAKVKGSVSNVRSHILGLGAAFVGVGGLTEGILASVKAAETLNVSTRALNAQLKANGESIAAIHPQVEKLNAQMANLGFTSSDAEQAFTRLDRASGSAAAATQYMGLTADFAAAKHVTLAQAALVVGKVMDGTTTAFNRYGIAIPKGTSATDALRIAQQKLAGQAAAAVTPQEKFHAVLTNIEAVVGEQLLPTIDQYLGKLSVWFSKSENQKKITDDVKQAVVLLKQAIEILTRSIVYIKDAFEKFSGAVGGSKHAIELLVAAFAAFKTASLLGSLATVATKVGLIGGSAEASTAQVGLLKGAIMSLGSAAVLGALALFGSSLAEAMATRKNAPPVSGFSRVPGSAGDGGSAYVGSNGNLWIRDPSGHMFDTGVKANAKNSGGVAPSMTHGPGGAHGGAGSLYGASLAGENPQISKGLNAVAAAGYNVDVTSEKRSYAQQAALYARYAASGFNIKYIAAKPGQSNHESGNAVDVYVNGKPVDQSTGALAILKKYGLVSDVPGDHEHLDYRGGASAQSVSYTGALPGDSIAAAATEKAKTAAAKKAEAAAKAAAAAAYKSWKENYFTPLDNQYKSDLLISNESTRLNKLEALHAKLAIDLKNTTGKEHQDIVNEETKVASKIMAVRTHLAAQQKALRQKEHAAYVQSLQADLTAAQASLQTQQTVFDRAWSRITSKLTGAVQAKYAAATPEEQARDAFQAQLDAAQKAADLSSAQNDLIAAQQAGDPQAVAAAQAHLDDVQNQQKLADLQDAATKSRAIQDAAGQTALDNLNDWLSDQKTALESGATTWDKFWSAAFSDAPEKYAPDAVSSLQGVITQMQTIKTLQDAINGGPAASLPNVSTGLAGSYFMLNPQIPHFAQGGVMPGAYGQPGLAVLHGGERVIRNGGGGGVVVNIHAPNYVGDKRDLSDAVVSALARYGLNNPSTIRSVLAS